MLPSITLTFLGTGTSQGIPVIGCSCEVCQSLDSRDQRLRASILVQVNSVPSLTFLIDSSPDFRMQALRSKIRQVDAVLFTHSHTDHVMGFDDLRRLSERCAQCLPIYAHQDVLNDLQRVFSFAFEAPCFAPWNPFPPHRIPLTGPFELGPLRILPMELPHGRFQVTGYGIEYLQNRKVAYFTDCNGIPEAVLSQVIGVDILIVGALRHRPHPSHFTLEQAVQAADQIQAKHTYLTHLSHDLGHEKTEALLPSNVSLAYDGLKISIPL